MSKFVIHSPRLQCNAYLIDLLDAAVWLSESRMSAAQDDRVVEIFLHPVGSPWIRVFHGQIRPKRIFSYVSRKIKRVLRRLVGHSDRGTGASGSSLIEQIHRRRTIEIQATARTKIVIRVTGWGPVRSTLQTLAAFSETVREWAKLSTRGRLDIQALLSLRYRDVPIGDLVASTVLSGEIAAGGSLRDCRPSAIFMYLLDAIFTLRHIASMPNKIQLNEYVAVPEVTYLEAIYLRALRQNGMMVMELYDYSGIPYLISKEEELRHTDIARVWDKGSLQDAELARVTSYLQDRLTKRESLWYMYIAKCADLVDTLTDNASGNLSRDEYKLTIVIFLHSFSDAQYWFGLDGFEDLYQWTCESIDHCLANPQIGRVLIKRHPGINLAKYPGDTYAEDKLQNRYKNESRLIFINRHANIKTLTELGYVYGITHHGSVAEELVASGLPCIASIYAPWGGNYSFLRTWDTPENYRELLRNLAVGTWKVPGKAEAEALARFVSEYRLSAEPEAARPISMQWMIWQDQATDVSDPDLSEKTERLIATLRNDSPELIDWLRERAAVYQPSAA